MVRQSRAHNSGRGGGETKSVASAVRTVDPDSRVVDARGAAVRTVAPANRATALRAPGARGADRWGPNGSLPPGARTALLVLLLLAGTALLSVAAQEETAFRTIEVEATNSTLKGADIDEWDIGGFGRASLDFQSQGNRSVRSRLSIEADIAETADGTDVRFRIPRAFIRARFPLGESYLFRTTFGKSRVTWGDGALYNAGDLVFGAAGSRADLFSTGSIRDETDWLVTAFFPLGQFSFIEPVVLVPETRISEGAGDQVTTDAPSFDRTALGTRIQWQLGSVKMETGYVFRGALEEHEAALSMQGNIGPDVYGGVASTFGPDTDGYERLRLTVGLFHQQRYGASSSVTVRIEGLVYPDQEWEELSEEDLAAYLSGSGIDGSTADSETGGVGGQLRSPYAISFFPEIVWSPSESLALFGRVLVSPVDVSALFIGGTEWNIYQGLTLGAYVSVQSGEKLDTYSFDRPGGAALTTSVKYVY